METRRFTRGIFGLVSSPFLLGRVIECHLELWLARMPELVTELRRRLSVDDLISGKPTVDEAWELKKGAIHVFENIKFTLHKWNLNALELDESKTRPEDEKTFAKQQLGQKEEKTGSPLGLSWNEPVSVSIPQDEVVASKRGLL